MLWKENGQPTQAKGAQPHGALKTLPEGASAYLSERRTIQITAA